MSEEGFLKRWSRLKATGGEAAASETAQAPVRLAAPAQPAPPPVPQAPPAQARAAEVAPPTLEDVARLTPESDFSAFVGRGVDKSVQRLALKKLFADPHFHVMDGLDMYMDDYNKPSPMSAAMLAALEHAKSALRPSEPARPIEAPPLDRALAAAGPAQDAPDAAGAEPAHEATPQPDAGIDAANNAANDAANDAAASDAAADAAPAAVAQASAPPALHDTYARPACTQAGTHPPSLQGQA